MKRIVLLTALFLSTALHLSAQEGPSKEFSIESKTGSKLQFSDINVSGQGSEYKSLCIKYINESANSNNKINIAGQDYLFFQDKKTAITHYYKTKGTASQRETYYVYSSEKKNPEVLSIRAS